MSETATATPPVAATPPPADKPTIDSPAAGEKAPGDFMADIVGDFEAMAEGKPAPSVPRDDKGKFVKPTENPKAAAKPEAPKPKADETKPVKPETQPAQDETKPTASETAPKPVKAAELRTAYESLKKRVREELEPELTRLKSQDAGALQKRIESLEQDNARLEQRMAFVDYSQSREFLTKYDQPFRDAWGEAVAEFKELTVKEQDGTNELDEPQYKTRAADENDLLRLANMRLSDMDAAAQQMFGASASRAIGHIQNIKKLSAAKHKALVDAQAKSGEWMKQRQAETLNRSKALAETWESINKGLQERFPRAFTPEEGNAEDKASYDRGFALADLLFLGIEAMTPEQVELLPKSLRESIKTSKSLNETQKVQLHAIARLKMANHDRQLTTIKALRSENAELKKALEEYEKSEPAADRAGKTSDKAATKDWLEQAEEELRAMDK